MSAPKPSLLQINNNVLQNDLPDYYYYVVGSACVVYPLEGPVVGVFHLVAPVYEVYPEATHVGEVSFFLEANQQQSPILQQNV